MVTTQAPAPTTTSELRAAGRELRNSVPRSSHAAWLPGADRTDPLELLEASNRTRLADLVAVRHGRMLQSPFTFYRGMPLGMASDLSRTPSTGIKVQICGDAHLLNFGTFATPERNLVFDVNDFDETHPGPWEWDVKRLAASLVIASRAAGVSQQGGDAVRGFSAQYRSRMAELASLSAFDVWHARIDVDRVATSAPTRQAQAAVQKVETKARQRTSLQALAKLTTVRGGRRMIVEDPPLVVRLGEEDMKQAFRFAKAYRSSLEPDRRLLLDRYVVVDAALKVVGVGSVGTRCYIVLLAGAADLDPLFLQIKEAQPSVLTGYVGGRSPFRNQGQRVVVGQKIMQAASDAFLGWARADGFDFYVRQLRDMKGSAQIDHLDGKGLGDYGRLCGATLAHAHARSGHPALLAGYLGTGPAFDEALAAFGVSYADQTERDYESFVKAVRSGRVPALEGR